MSSRRLPRLDALRGLAMVWMAGFHFSFDLNQYGLIGRQNFYADPFWTTQRTLIVTLFLLCAGLGQALAFEHSARMAWRRWSQIAGCALLVSVGSWWMFPHSFIWFGVLHAMAVMLLLLQALRPRPGGWMDSAAGAAATQRWGWGLAAAALLLPLWVAHPFFDSRLTGWVGLVTHKPITEDYVPLLPWFGVMLGGWLLGRRLIGQPTSLGFRLLAGDLGGWWGWAIRPLARLGRWPLSFYMLHQPVLLALLALPTWLS